MQTLSRALPPSRVRLDLTGVNPLLEFLFALPQDSSDRPLTWLEDEHACEILRDLVPPDSPYLGSKVDEFTEPENREYRTLCVWYHIARCVARMIQAGE